MNKLRINRRNFSSMFWRIILNNESLDEVNRLNYIRAKSNLLERGRLQATYNTGSLDFHSQMSLFKVCSYFQPKVIAEVGTFIGRSTIAMATAIQDIEGSIIYTCDISNSIQLNLDVDTRVVQYEKQGSLEMFKDLEEQKVLVDLFFIDGRLTEHDVHLVKKISKPNSIIVLDDFEGIEKGITNSILLANAGFAKSHCLVYPENSANYFNPRVDICSSLGLVLPLNQINFTAQ